MHALTRLIMAFAAAALLLAGAPSWAQDPGSAQPSAVQQPAPESQSVIQTQPANVEPQPEDANSNRKPPAAPQGDGGGGAAGAGTAQGISVGPTVAGAAGGLALLGLIVALSGGKGGSSSSTH